MVSLLRGYLTVRSLPQDELDLFPIVWAAYYARRICELHAKWSPNARNRVTWRLEDRIRSLPDEALAQGEGVLRRL